MKSLRLLLGLLGLVFLLNPLLANADPPDWAPAHGYRDRHYRHDDERDDEDRGGDRERGDYRRPVTRADIGIETGTCNREAIGTVLGGVVGGAVGSKIGGDQGNQGVGLVVGAIIGAAIGQSIGRQMDDADRQCTVQVLEQAHNGQTIAWTNPVLGVAYRLTPIATYEREGHVCRRYRSIVTARDRHERTVRVACRVSNGTWRVEPAH